MTREEYDALRMLADRHAATESRLNVLEDRTVRMETDLGYVRAGLDRLQHHVFDGNGKPSMVNTLNELSDGLTHLQHGLNSVHRRLDTQTHDDAEVRKAKVAGVFAFATAAVGAVVSIVIALVG